MPILLLLPLLAQPAKFPDPVALARKMDAAIAQLRGIEGEGLMQIDVGGGSGFAKTMVYVKDAKQFSIQFTDVYPRGASSGEVRSDGTRKAWLDNAKETKKAVWEPMSKSARPFARTGASLLKAFPMEFPRLVFSPLTAGKTVFADLVVAAKRAGYVVQVSERNMVAKDQVLKNWRVVLANPPAQQKKVGVERIEFVVNQTYSLPISIYVTKATITGSRTRLAWTMGWHRVPKFKADQFKFPAKG